MFFKKRVKVLEFIVERVKEFLTEGGTFTLESFFDEYQKILTFSGIDEEAGEREEETITLLDRDLFINRFIGTLLWLIKYRTLTSAKNSSRKLAFLDLKFDIEMPATIPWTSGARRSSPGNCKKAKNRVFSSPPSGPGIPTHILFT
jgi:hypothetical protein